MSFLERNGFLYTYTFKPELFMQNLNNIHDSSDTLSEADTIRLNSALCIFDTLRIDNISTYFDVVEQFPKDAIETYLQESLYYPIDVGYIEIDEYSNTLFYAITLENEIHLKIKNAPKVKKRRFI